MKPQGTLTIASLALVTGLSGALVTPSAQADGHGRYDRYDRHDRRRYPARHYLPRGRGYASPYYGYGYPYVSNRAVGTIGITAVTLGLLDLLNAEQQRRHEAALINAVSRPGEVIVWDDGSATGTVQTTRSGTSTSGRQCREFQQTVMVGGKTRQAYGTACLQPDGAWEIIPTP